MVSTTQMLLFMSSAGTVRRAVGNFGPSAACAFLHAPTFTVVPTLTRQHLSKHLMSTDAAAEEKTEEEQAAIHAAREARK
jgi:hypothetical protein